MEYNNQVRDYQLLKDTTAGFRCWDIRIPVLTRERQMRLTL
jgi:hypothetical protein